MTNDNAARNRRGREEERKLSEPLIVGIGASAGGLEALQQFLLYMPVNSGLSFVVIQHLSPDYKSLMADILGKNTEMMVLQAENGMAVEPNTVYLIPPKNNMTIQDGKLILTQFVQGMLNHPIDVFFTSLAKEQRERAIAVIFSGTGSDGTNGIKSVKENGGLVVVQDPSTAKFDGMPESAINTGLVDFVLSPREVVDEILNFSNYPSIIQPNTDEEFFSDEETFTKIYGILKKISGIDFTYYKRTTVMRRIERRMVVTHSSNLVQYAKMLTEDSGEAEILVKEILIGVTNFFRDPVFFEKLKSQVISTIVKRTEDKEPNFLSSTMIGILFVDSNLNIRKFTEYVGREFQLMDHDVGRSIQIFAHSFPNEDIVKDAQTVLKNLVPIDREVAAMNGRYYTLRIAPYRTMENSIRGLVITIIDSLGTSISRKGE